MRSRDREPRPPPAPPPPPPPPRDPAPPSSVPSVGDWQEEGGIQAGKRVAVPSRPVPSPPLWPGLPARSFRGEPSRAEPSRAALQAPSWTPTLREERCEDRGLLSKGARSYMVQFKLVSEKEQMLGACGMQKCHQEALKKNRVSLAKQLVLKELMEHLIEKDIITEEMMEMIQARSGSFSQNIELLNLLPKRGPKAFSAFCEALQATKQQHLEEMLLSSISSHSNGTMKLSHDYEESLSFPVCELGISPKRRCWNHAEPMEHFLDDGDGPRYPNVKPCTPEFYHAHESQAYKLKSCPRGLALILSNVHFSSETDLEFRSGGNVDNAALNMLFKHLGYQVVIKHDLTAQEMQEELEKFSKLSGHRDVDSCIVSLLSHGKEGGVYGVDGKLLQLQEIFRFFDNANCPNLQNKPKMFFIQACRGDETDRGVDQIDGNEHADSPGCEESDANKRENPKLRLPTCSDMIYGYACLKGTAAMRNTKRGSWYIEALTSVFAEDSRNTHVADMLVKVNQLIKHREGHAPGTEFHRCKEMSEYCSTLCKDLYLFPGYFPEKQPF